MCKLTRYFLKFIWKRKRAKNSQDSLEEEEQTRGRKGDCDISVGLDRQTSGTQESRHRRSLRLLDLREIRNCRAAGKLYFQERFL